jgi:flagellar biogenesis protein FliO
MSRMRLQQEDEKLPCAAMSPGPRFPASGENTMDIQDKGITVLGLLLLIIALVVVAFFLVRYLHSPTS